jgi:peptide/nickel transport system permease protein
VDLPVIRGVSLFVVRLMGLLLVTAAGTFALLSFSPVDPIRAYIGNDLLHVPPSSTR